MTEIRKLRQSDVLLWKAMRLDSLQQHPENYLSSYEEESLRSLSDWKNILKNNDIFGLFVGDELVSIVSFSIMSRYKYRHKGEIWGVYTSQEHRGKGYSNTLMQTVLSHAATKVKQCILTVTDTNHHAYKMYNQLGFKTYGIEPKAIEVDGEFHNEILMIICFY
jgi:ribosomal protein S18 acetylase RimI-like enzyme